MYKDGTSRYASKVSFSNYINKKLLCESSLLKDGTSGTTQEQAEQPREQAEQPREQAEQAEKSGFRPISKTSHTKN